MNFELDFGWVIYYFIVIKIKMFRIESYITSIILSYVEKYVKNLRRQDAQV